jgi:biotin carboxyl carrier protein
MKKNYLIDLGERSVTATLLDRSGPRLTFAVEGTTYSVTVRPELSPPTFSGVMPLSGPITPASSSREQSPPTHSVAHSVHSAEQVTSPLPGMVAAILVKVGQTVAPGTPLAVVEAMKMENSVPATQGGVIAEIFVTVGQEISVGDVLMRLEKKDIAVS